MPGIITHNRVFIESINYLKKEKRRSINSKSVEILFKSDSCLRAGLFGAIGPDAFACLPFKKNNFICGSDISYVLHSPQNEKLLKSMLITLMSYTDQNTEWTAIQRAYLYGLISHLIADSIFHPFIYYWSGFTSSKDKKEQSYFREQHLVFENNIDIFFSQYQNDDTSGNKFNFNLNDMLPTANHKNYYSTERAIKVFLIDSLEEAFPDIYQRLVFIKDQEDKKWPAFFIMDILPLFIKLYFKIKKSRNPQLIRFINYIKKKNIAYSDYFIGYPPAGKINTHVLNLHKERWFHPAGTSGLHYESIKDLLFNSSARIAEIWKKIEAAINSNRKDTSEIEKDFRINPITGIFEKDYYSMKVQNPVHLRF
ncbi:MAG: zinc dependent phospholipase C family protein [Spirochaetes bacterium]|nr:zinc dependent phospholipase C family protein [Spirochaetota bacterium]